MGKIFLMTIATVTAAAALAHSDGAGVTPAKIMELSAHRVERLITLNRIDASFSKKLDSIEVSVVPNEAPVFYKARVSQTKPAQGAPMQLEISFDDDGKPLAFQVLANGAAGPEVGWPDKSSVELIENSLHYVLDNAADAKIEPFDKTATGVILTKTTLNGQEVARSQMSSSASTNKLNIYLRLDGTFISAEVVP